MNPGNAKTVMIIEDDRNTANLIAVYLKRDGFRTLTSADGEAGLALAEKHHPDLVILDLMLPKLDGWEVCRRLRQASEVPIIMLTARAEEVDRVAGLTLGADDYVVKPFSPREIMARMTAISSQIAAGDFSVRVPAGTRDEVGSLRRPSTAWPPAWRKSKNCAAT